MAKKKTQRPPQTPRKADKQIGIQGDRVRLARMERHWTQFELARRSNIHVSALSLVEGGRKELNALSVISLCRALEVSADYLLGLTNETGRK